MRKVLLLGLAAVLLTGCESLHLYNAGRDKQSAEVKDTWKTVDLSGIVTTERQNLDKLLAAELATQDRLAGAIRDQQLRVLASSTPISVSLVAATSNRLLRLTGSSDSEKDLVQIQNARIALANLIARMEEGREAVAIESGVSTTCDALSGGKTPKSIQTVLSRRTDTDRVLLNGYLGDLRRRCASIDSAQAQIDMTIGQFSGRIAAARAQWKKDEADLAEAEQQVAAAKKIYDAAIAAYQAEVKALQQGAPKTDRLQKLFGDIQNAAEKLESIQGGLGKEIVAKDRLEAIEQALQVLSGKEKAESLSDPALREDLAPLLALQHWWDETAALLAKARQPRMTPFLIEQEHQRLALESAKREVQAGKTTAALAKQIWESLVAQALLLNGVRMHLAKLTAFHAMSLPDALEKARAADRQQLYSVAGRYLDAIGRIDGQSYRLEYQRLSSIHGNALAQSEVSMLMWKNLIGTSVEQLADYHASGLKPESFVQLMQALGVVWIGSGVNK